MIIEYTLLLLVVIILYNTYIIIQHNNNIKKIEIEYENLKKYTDVKNVHPILKTQVDTLNKVLQILKDK